MVEFNPERNNKVKNLIIMITATFAIVLIYHFVGKVIEGHIADSFAADFLAEVFFAVLVLITVIIFKKTYIFKTDRALLKGNRKSAGLLIAVSLYLLFSGLVSLLDTGLKASPMQILMLTGQCVLIGFCEETLFRGLIQRELHDIFGEDSFKNVFLAVLCTGVIFGLAHMVNIDRGVPLFSVILQAEVNIFAGMYYAAVFFRTGKNLPYMIFLHAFYDFAAMIANGRLEGKALDSILAPADATAVTLLQAVLVWGTFYIVPTLFILRKKKIIPFLSVQK